MIRPVLKMGEERLLEKAMPVKAFGTPELRRLVVDMWDTMDVEGGIGIAHNLCVQGIREYLQIQGREERA